MSKEEVLNKITDNSFKKIISRCFNLMDNDIAKIVNIKYSANDCGVFEFLDKDGDLNSSAFQTKPSRLFKMTVECEFKRNGIKEEDIEEIIIEEMHAKINRDIINDLRDNATIKISSLRSQVSNNIINLKNKIKKESGYEPNWLICSPDAINDIENSYVVKCDEELNTPDVIAKNELRARLSLPTINFIESLSLGTLKMAYVPQFNLNIFKDALSPPDKILVGYKGEEDHESSYHYVISDITNHIVVDRDIFIPENHITLHKAKQITNHSLFGLIELEDFEWGN